MVPAENGDILTLAADGLRQQDVDELAAVGLLPVPALIQSFNASWPHVFTILADGEPCAMFGVTPAGVPWMLGTDRMLTIPRDLIVQGQWWIEYLNRLHPVLENWVAVDNTVSVHWLKRMGFEFHETHVINNTTFRRFTRCVNPQL